MDALTHGGTPPTLWLNRIFQRRGPQHELRLRRLANQIEKLSWMIALMDEEPAINLEGAESQWQHEHASLE